MTPSRLSPTQAVESLLGIAPEQFEMIWKMVVEFGEYERHFNNIQSVYRGLASTWILAMFSAVGFILYGSGSSAQKGIFVSLIGSAAAGGILLLWSLDVFAYHRLLLAVYAGGVKLEQACPWLPQIRRKMKSRVYFGPEGDTVSKDRLRKIISLFYLFLTIIAAAVGAFGVFWTMAGDVVAKLPATWGFVWLTPIAGLTAVACILYGKSKKVGDKPPNSGEDPYIEGLCSRCVSETLEHLGVNTVVRKGSYCARPACVFRLPRQKDGNGLPHAP